MRILIPIGIVASVCPTVFANAESSTDNRGYDDQISRVEICQHVNEELSLNFEGIFSAMTSAADVKEKTPRCVTESEIERIELLREAVKKCLIERVECRGGP